MSINNPSKTVFDDYLAECEKINTAGKGYLDGLALNYVPASTYHAENRFVSKHMLDLFADSPEKYQYALTHPEEDESPALRFGEAFHTAVLEPDRYREDYVQIPPIIKVKRGKEWEAFQRENEGKIALSVPEFAKIEGMRTALHMHDKASELLFGENVNDWENELTILFNAVLPNGNVRACKARIDRLIEDTHTIVDLKTCVSANPKAFQRAVLNFRYDVQASFYTHAVKSAYADGEEWRFAIVAIEKEPPYAIAVYYLDDWMQAGYEGWGVDIQRLVEAEKSGVFEGYRVKNDKLPMPPYAQKERGVWDVED